MEDETKEIKEDFRKKLVEFAINHNLKRKRNVRITARNTTCFHPKLMDSQES